MRETVLFSIEAGVKMDTARRNVAALSFRVADLPENCAGNTARSVTA